MAIKKRSKITAQEFLDAIPESKGLFEPIEKKLGCTRGAIRELLEEYPELEAELKDEEEREKDRVIFAMYEDAVNGDPREKGKARETLMRAVATDRGFGGGGGKTEINISDAPLVMLHTSAKLPTVQEWAKKAEKFNQERNLEVEAKVLEITGDSK